MRAVEVLIQGDGGWASSEPSTIGCPSVRVIGLADTELEGTADGDLFVRQAWSPIPAATTSRTKPRPLRSGSAGRACERQPAQQPSGHARGRSCSWDWSFRCPRPSAGKSIQRERLRGCHTSHTANASRPRSRTSSAPYAVCPGPPPPPPPKHRSRYSASRRSGHHTEDEDQKEHRGRRSDDSGGDASKQQEPEGDLCEWQPPADNGHQGGRKQLVGAPAATEDCGSIALTLRQPGRHRPGRAAPQSRPSGQPRRDAVRWSLERSTGPFHEQREVMLERPDRSAWRPDHHSRVAAESDHLR